MARFGMELERELILLHEELDSGRYVPGPYRIFTIYERKPRIIAAAPLRDRIVHHALMQVVEPQLDVRFIFVQFMCLLCDQQGCRLCQVSIQQFIEFMPCVKPCGDGCDDPHHRDQAQQ